MQLRLTTGLICAVLFAPLGAAQDETRTEGPLALAIGNTVVVTYATGEVVQLHLRADGTLDILAPDGGVETGHWLADERYFCIVNHHPRYEIGQNLRCEELDLSDKALGESWDHTDSYGYEVAIVVNEGQ